MEIHLSSLQLKIGSNELYLFLIHLKIHMYRYNHDICLKILGTIDWKLVQIDHIHKGLKILTIQKYLLGSICFVLLKIMNAPSQI